jgi:hypothetical protein
MVATATHLIEGVIPPVEVRQWVISFPFSIRWILLQHAHHQKILQIVFDEIQKTVIAKSSAHAPSGAQVGAISFFQNFGATLNLHPHFHIVVTDGFFSKSEQVLQFWPIVIEDADIKKTENNICHRVLHYLIKKKALTSLEEGKILAKENSGFSLDGSVHLESWNRSGLERLLRYCCRPSFTSENLRWDGKRVTYNLSKPNHKGQTSIQLGPVEFIDRIATLIPIPHRHRRHYFGAFAPHSPLRKLVALNAKHRPEHFIPPPLQQIADKARKASLEWAALIAKIYEVDPLICSKCGGRVKILGFVTHRVEILRILQGIGWQVEFHEFDPPHSYPEYNMSQLLPNTPDGFPEIENQEWSQGCHCRDHNRHITEKEQKSLVPDQGSPKESYPPLHWEQPDSYCDPPHEEEVYVDPPNEWD